VTVIAAFWAMVPPQMEKCMAFAKSLHAVGLFLATSVSLLWWELPYDLEPGASAAQWPAVVVELRKCCF